MKDKCETDQKELLSVYKELNDQDRIYFVTLVSAHLRMNIWTLKKQLDSLLLEEEFEHECITSELTPEEMELITLKRALNCEELVIKKSGEASDMSEAIDVKKLAHNMDVMKAMADNEEDMWLLMKLKEGTLLHYCTHCKQAGLGWEVYMTHDFVDWQDTKEIVCPDFLYNRAETAEASTSKEEAKPKLYTLF